MILAAVARIPITFLTKAQKTITGIRVVVVTFGPIAVSVTGHAFAHIEHTVSVRLPATSHVLKSS
jgi:hypothetical protein